MIISRLENYKFPVLKLNEKQKKVVYVINEKIHNRLYDLESKTFKSDFGIYFQNAHTFHFSLTTLTNLFNTCGFDLLYRDEYMRSVFKLKGNSDNAKLVNDYDPVLNTIIKTESYRTSISNKLNSFKKSCYLTIIKMLKILGIKSLIQKSRLNK